MGNNSNSADQLSTTVEESKLISHRCVHCGGYHQIDVCPLKDKGMPCIRCSKFSHIGKPGRSTRVTQKSVIEMKNAMVKADKTLETDSHLPSLRLRLDHGSTVIKAVICTGTKHSFMRRSKFMELEYKPVRKQLPTVERLLGIEIQTLGSYELHMSSGYEGHYIQCHILNDDLLTEEMVLGMNFVSNVEIVIKNGKVSVRRTKKIESENKDSAGMIFSTIRD